MTRRRIKRIGLFLLILAPAAYVAPIPTAALLACGLLDVSRHRKVSLQLIEEYFTGKGLLTWVLSPVNLLADLLSGGTRRAEQLSDLPDDCRREITACVDTFLANKALITDVVAPHLAEEKRVMLAFKWFGTRLDAPVRVAEFDRDFRYVKTIAVSTFRGYESTSWHFGPQRLTLRVLRNLEPIEDPEVYVAVDDRVHHWREDPLLIFDDTLFHRSVNNCGADRHCLFIDVVRPSRFHWGFETAVQAMGLTASTFRQIFYKNWSFLQAQPQAGSPSAD